MNFDVAHESHEFLNRFILEIGYFFPRQAEIQTNIRIGLTSSAVIRHIKTW